MAFLKKMLNSTTGKSKLIAYPGWKDVSEVVASSPKATFSLGYDIDSAHVIDAWVDGRFQIEALSNFTRDNSANTVTFAESVPVGKTVLIRIYLK